MRNQWLWRSRVKLTQGGGQLQAKQICGWRTHVGGRSSRRRRRCRGRRWSRGASPGEPRAASSAAAWVWQNDLQNLELFPSEAEWPLFVSFTHLQVQTQAWCARKGWRGACKKSFIFNSSELTGSMAISLRHEEQFCLTITSQSQIKPKDVKHVSSSATNKSGFLYQI